MKQSKSSKYVYLANVKDQSVIKITSDKVYDFVQYDADGVNVSNYFFTTKIIYNRFLDGHKTNFIQHIEVVNMDGSKKTQAILVNAVGIYANIDRRRRRATMLSKQYEVFNNRKLTKGRKAYRKALLGVSDKKLKEQIHA